MATTVPVNGALTLNAVNSGTLTMNGVTNPSTINELWLTWINWSVVNGTGKATIDSNGILKGVANGTVTVSATGGAADGSTISGTAQFTVVTGSNANSCNPSCVNAACGASDGCGGACQNGSCSAGQICSAGTCVSSSAPTCTSWTYSVWSPATCPSSGVQTRTITSLSPWGCQGGNPQALSQTCTYASSTTPTSTTTGWCHDFNTNLKAGDTGDEVQALQTALGKEGLLTGTDIEKDNGPTMNPNYVNIFGDNTASAVVGFQEKYASEILAPSSLKHGTGKVGPSTRAKLNALYGCAASATTTVPAPRPSQTPTTTTTTDTSNQSLISQLIAQIAQLQTQIQAMLAQQQTTTQNSTQPTISSISSSSGQVGSSITITGTNFDSKYNQIRFGNCGYYTTQGDQYNVPSVDGKTIMTTVPHIMDGVGVSGSSGIEVPSYPVNCMVSMSNNSSLTSNSVPFTVTSSSSTQPTITVTSPNGGENWTQGQIQNISWASTGLLSTDRIDIWLYHYGQDGSKDGQSMIAAVAGTTTYNPWIVSAIPGLSSNSNYKILLQVYRDTVHNIVLTSDSSNNYFTIAAAAATTTCTNGTTQTCTVGTQTCVNSQWGACTASAQPTATLNIQDGTIYNPNAKLFSWTILNADSGQFLILGPTGGSCPGVTVKDAVAGNNFDCGDMFRSVGVNSSVALTFLNTTNAPITLSANIDPVRNGVGNMAWSKTVTFQIPPSTQPSITVTSPNGGETWKVGETHNITARFVLVNKYNIIAKNIDDGSSYSIGEDLYTTIPFTWTVGKNVPNYTMTMGRYKIEIFDDTNSGAIDTSDNSFTISAATAACTDSNWTSALSPTVCPAGGGVQAKNWTQIGTCSGGVTHPQSEFFSCTAPAQTINGQCGSANNITSSTAPTTNLCSSGTAHTTPYVSSSAPVLNESQWTWYCVGSNGGTAASCEAPYASPAQPSITVTSPNGGENWKVGETHNITWTSSGVQSVNIGLTPDGGGTQYPLFNQAIPASSGNYSWTIPSSVLPGTTYKIIIGSSGIVSTYNYSNNNFTIAALVPDVPALACTSKWICTLGACVAGQQTNTCVDSNSCPVPTSKPAATQSCACTPNWYCGWGSCVNGSQSYSILDRNKCGLPTSQSGTVCPPLKQACTVSLSTPAASASLLDAIQSQLTSISNAISQLLQGK